MDQPGKPTYQVQSILTKKTESQVRDNEKLFVHFEKSIKSSNQDIKVI
jgi:hypothetical protein